jgi:glutamyl/glutaminyl-tRNA synthetase
LLAGLLAWLDARARGAHLALRLEDIDPDRCRPELRAAMADELAWLGLDFDDVQEQHRRTPAHEAALDRLASAGLLYPCVCTRAHLRASGRRSPDGGFAYPNTCRARALPSGGWRESREPLRFRLPAGTLQLADESGLDLSQDAAAVMGDPVVRRRDGAIAYQLAVVVDDGDDAITRVVRGRDIAPSTATQVWLQRSLGYPTPVYRHHLLLLEPRGDKLAKLHGSVGAPELRRVYDAPTLVGFLAHAAGLVDEAGRPTPSLLLPGFDWKRVCSKDRVVTWDGERLRVG